MSHTRAWRNFRRLEDSLVAFGALVCVGAGLEAWRTIPAPHAFKVLALIAAPAAFMSLAALIPLIAPPLRAALSRYVWRSFISGFGQSVRTVLTGFGLPAGAAVLVLVEVHTAAHGGRYPVAILAAYAAGVGILIAQSILTRMLERDPDVRARIEP